MRHTSGPCEFTTRINEPSSKPTEHDSQESIIGNNDIQNGVMVSISYDIRYKQDGDDGITNWYGSQRGVNKVSVRAGPDAVKCLKYVVEFCPTIRY